MSCWKSWKGEKVHLQCMTSPHQSHQGAFSLPLVQPGPSHCQCCPWSGERSSRVHSVPGHQPAPVRCGYSHVVVLLCHFPPLRFQPQSSRNVSVACRKISNGPGQRNAQKYFTGTSKARKIHLCKYELAANRHVHKLPVHGGQNGWFTEYKCLC